MPARRRSLSWLQATIVYLNGTSGLVDVLYGDETEECDIPPSRTLRLQCYARVSTRVSTRAARVAPSLRHYVRSVGCRACRAPLCIPRRIEAA